MKDSNRTEPSIPPGEAATNAHRAAALLNRPGRSPADVQAAARLLLGYRERHMHRLRRARLNEADAEEVFADTVTKFITHPPRGEHCEAYLWTLLKQQTIGLYRRRDADKRKLDGWAQSTQPGSGDALDEPAIDPPSNEDLAATVELRDWLQKCYARMLRDKSPYCEVVMMLAEEWEYGEIAASLGTSAATARQRVCAARRAAASYFEACRG